MGPFGDELATVWRCEPILPMIVHATGSEIRRNFALILHDAPKPATTRVDHWKPGGCAEIR